jgi:hypothetical protein
MYSLAAAAVNFYVYLSNDYRLLSMLLYSASAIDLSLCPLKIDLRCYVYMSFGQFSCAFAAKLNQVTSVTDINFTRIFATRVVARRSTRYMLCNHGGSWRLVSYLRKLPVFIYDTSIVKFNYCHTEFFLFSGMSIFAERCLITADGANLLNTVKRYGVIQRGCLSCTPDDDVTMMSR